VQEGDGRVVEWRRETNVRPALPCSCRSAGCHLDERRQTCVGRLLLRTPLFSSHCGLRAGTRLVPRDTLRSVPFVSGVRVSPLCFFSYSARFKTFVVLDFFIVTVTICLTQKMMQVQFILFAIYFNVACILIFTYRFTYLR
jgi:hypothetical protein